MEGTIASVPPREEKTSSTRIFTSRHNKYLFICGGAFAGLDKVIEEEEKVALLGLGQK